MAEKQLSPRAVLQPEVTLVSGLGSEDKMVGPSCRTGCVLEVNLRDDDGDWFSGTKGRGGGR